MKPGEKGRGRGKAFLLFGFISHFSSLISLVIN